MEFDQILVKKNFYSKHVNSYKSQIKVKAYIASTRKKKNTMEQIRIENNNRDFWLHNNF